MKIRIRRKNLILIICIVLVIVCILFVLKLMDKDAQLRRAMREYPTAYTPLIAKYAEEYELDPYLVTSIMRCESSNKPDAVSNRGAIGLMQIMPDTGTWIAHKLEMDSVYQEYMLYDPETNIRFACWYLRFLATRFSGVTLHIVAAYNAGHGSVENWLADERYSSGGTLTSIPYPETARYVEKINAAYQQYTTLYPDLYTPAASPVAEADGVMLYCN